VKPHPLFLVVALGAAACATEVDEPVERDAMALDANVKTQSACMIGVRAASAQLDGGDTRLVVETDGCGMAGELEILLSPVSSLEETVVDLVGEVRESDEFAHDAYGVWGRDSPVDEHGYLHVMVADEGDVVAELAGDALFDAEGRLYRFDGELWVVR